MRLFGYTIEKTKPDIKTVILNKTKSNAELGIVHANLDLRLHTLLLEQLEAKLPGNEELEREVTLTKEAIERDKKSLNNYQTQLKAIAYECEQG